MRRLLALNQSARTGQYLVPVQKARLKLRQYHENRGKDEPEVVAPEDASRGVAMFTVGPAERPSTIEHDHGFLDTVDSAGHHHVDAAKRIPPTWADYAAKTKWVAMLEGAELLRPDLIDATAAYRHFLFSGGTDRWVDYERFVQGDSRGKRVLDSAMEDARAGAIELQNASRPMTPPKLEKSKFSMRSTAVGVAGGDVRYPYPATENWQKAIGAHVLWLTADVEVTSDPERAMRSFEITMTINMEDMFNFNPGNQDIVTGIADSENGRFELTGLAQEFLQKGSLRRTIKFQSPLAPIDPRSSEGGPTDPGRPRPTSTPRDSRR